VYDIIGNEIITLVNKNYNPGNYSLNFNGSNYSSGVYLYKLLADGKSVDSKKMVILK
jgi:hypothetical protein